MTITAPPEHPVAVESPSVRGGVVVVSAAPADDSSTALLVSMLVTSVWAAGGGEPTVLQLRDSVHDVADAQIGGAHSAHLKATVGALRTADALVVVTPTFGGGYSGMLKGFLDVLPRRALQGVPVVLAATGGSLRHSLMIEHALRPLMSLLHAVPVPTGVFATRAELAPAPAVQLELRVARAVDELLAATSSPVRIARAEEAAHR